MLIFTHYRTVENMISNRKVSENRSLPITRNKKRKKRENVKTQEGTYADVVKNGIEEKNGRC